MTDGRQFPESLPDKIVSVENIDEDIGRWSNVEWISVVDTLDRAGFTQVTSMVVETKDEIQWRATWEEDSGWVVGKLTRNAKLLYQPPPPPTGEKQVEKY